LVLTGVVGYCMLGEGNMPEYRVYFRGPAGIHGRHDFEAEGDPAATVIAELLYEACSDQCEHFELWRGKIMIYPFALSGPPASGAIVWSSIVALRQEIVRRNEELIRDSHWTIAKSKQLLMSIRELEGKGVLPKDAASDGARQRRWRMKAEELRTAGDQMTDPARQRYYRRLAANYEALADHDERGSSSGRKTGVTP
jgi:hypothetical protein